MVLIGIDVSSALAGPRSGVGNYTMNLVRQLQQQEEVGNACFMYFSNRDGQLFVERSGALGAATTYPYDRLRWHLVWMTAGLPRSVARTRPDMLHFPNHLAPITGLGTTPYVLTVHDMSVYRCPQYHTRKTVAVHRAVMPLAARHARAIVTVSDTARQDILQYLNVPPERVRVVHEGVGPQFRPLATPREPHPDELRRRYALPELYILTVSTIEPRKNHGRLLEAFRWLTQQEHIPHHLLIAGAHGWKDTGLRQWVRRHGLADRVRFLGYVPECDLPGLYRAADIFAYPSLYEGFGLPVLEAMASGIPCVISTDPALCEVAGKSNVVAVNPYSASDIAAGLFAVLHNPDLAAELRHRGLVRAGTFTWGACAEQTYQLYCDVTDAAASPVATRDKRSGTRQPWLTYQGGLNPRSRLRSSRYPT